MQQEILRVPELAKMLGRSESSIRSAMQAGAAWVPPGFKQGRFHCWRTDSVREFLRRYEAGENQPVKQGRKRREPPTLKLAQLVG